MKKEQIEQINQRLQSAIEAVINQQIAENNPPQTTETIERLQSEGFSREEAYILVGHLVSMEVAEELIGEKGIDMERYIDALEKLPAPFAKPRVKDDDDD
jgi:phosphohistidine phosphatase SixA